MVHVLVGEQNRIHVVDPRTQGLLPQIGPRIDQHGPAGHPQPSGRTEALVARVGTGAHAAAASDDRNALAGACAEEGETHRRPQITRSRGANFAAFPAGVPHAVERRGGRAVDRGGLENRFTRKGNGGSNPSLSAAAPRVGGSSSLSGDDERPSCEYL